MSNSDAESQVKNIYSPAHPLPRTTGDFHGFFRNLPVSGGGSWWRTYNEDLPLSVSGPVSEGHGFHPHIRNGR